jgi:sugar transferase (PEP-CTERM/EpsH1 system associated)
VADPVRILFLTQRTPYPPNRGAKITSWRLIERMARSHEVVCLTFAHDEEEREGVRQMNAKGIETIAFPLRGGLAKIRSLPLLLTSKPLTLGFFGSRELQAEVDRQARTCDLAYAYSSSMCAFLEHLDIPCVMHFAELDSDKWRQYAERERFPMSWIYRREYRTLREVEKRLAAAGAENVLCTTLEKEIFDREIPGVSSMVLRNGIDLDYYRPSPELVEPNHIVFTGVMDYLPNVDGCVWFVNEVLPRLRERCGDVRFTIIGADPNAEVLALAKEPGVTVTGFVDDTRDFLRRGALSVAPLRIARGIQNKVLEAMAMGHPVVGTTCATQGVEGEPGRDYLVADDADGIYAAVARLLEHPDEGRALGARARKFVEERYDWEVVFDPLDELVERLTQRRDATTP